MLQLRGTLCEKSFIVALAALAATASFAQSSVTLSGNLDFAAGNVKLDGQASETSISTRDLASTTSVINIIAVEDLGGGMKATAKFGIDPRHMANDGVSPTRDELFVGIEGGFGNLRLGSPNSIGLTTFGVGTPFGTGVGGGYGVLALDYSFIRHNRSARYDSPSFGGLSFAVLHAPGADAAVSQTAAGTPAAFIPAAGAVTEIGVSYANGPLTVAYANISQPKYLTSVKVSTNILSANYKLGNTTLYAGWNDGDVGATASRTTTATESKGSRVAVRQDIGAVALMASYAEQKSLTVKEKVTGLRADYNLSKTAAVYAAYEMYDNGAATNSDRTITSVGIRKSF